mgnify:FL=1
MIMDDITIDAANQILGRVASNVALLLMGKDLPSFAPNRIPDRRIVVKNAGSVKVTGQKAEAKLYYRHSMYPGGLKSITFEAQMRKDSRKVVEWAVYGMLPKNRLRSQMMKHLTIHTNDAR